MTRQVRHLPSGELLVTDLEIAETRGARRKGLLGRDSLPDGAGLLIPKAWSIHTFWMRFAIDVLFLDRDLGVRRVVRELRPFRLCSSLLATHCLEMPAGALAAVPVAPGDLLEIEEY